MIRKLQTFEVRVLGAFICKAMKTEIEENEAEIDNVNDVTRS